MIASNAALLNSLPTHCRIVVMENNRIRIAGALILSSVFFLGALAHAEPVRKSSRARSSSLVMTAGRLYRDSSAQVKKIQKIIAAHKKLLHQAESSGLIVAIDAIRKDISANQELLSLGRDLLADLQTDLALKDAEASAVAVDDPLQYTQVKQIRILRDQAQRLYVSDKRFLKKMQGTTQESVKRLDE